MVYINESNRYEKFKPFLSINKSEKTAHIKLCLKVLISQRRPLLFQTIQG